MLISIITMVLVTLATGKTIYADNIIPMADAGMPVYVHEGPVQLDGSGSFDPDGSSLTYNWTQVSGEPLVLNDVHAPRLDVNGFEMTSTIQRFTFELVVSDGELSSEPAQVDLVVVQDFNEHRLTQVNGPFNPTKPTIIGFEGGDCVTGRTFNFGSNPVFVDNANLFNTSSSYSPPFHLYADYLITYLNSVAPNYNQPIQTQGHSTGGMPSMEVALRLNEIYADARYRINKVVLLDHGCEYPYQDNIRRLNALNMDGEPFLIENYYSYAPHLEDTLNIRFPVPPADHGTPLLWYRRCIQEDLYNDGDPSGFYLSVAGPARNFISGPDLSLYMFDWIPGGQEYLTPTDPNQFPGLIPEVPVLIEPFQINAENNFTLTCTPCRNVTRYELLMGPDRNLENMILMATGSEPPEFLMTELPYEQTWWTVKAWDAHGSSVYPDPLALTETTLKRPVVNERTGQRYGSIQTAIKEAGNVDTIVIGQGTYLESITLDDKSVIIKSEDPTDPGCVANTVIQGNPYEGVINLLIPQTRPTIIIGLTLTGEGDGIKSSNNGLMVEHCVIRDNRGTGLDLNQTDAMLNHCIIYGNGNHGIVNINNPQPPSPGSRGSSRTRILKLEHCIVAGNRGCGLISNSASVTFSTIAHNSVYGLEVDTLDLSNSIVYFNGPADTPCSVQSETPNVNFSNIQGGWDGKGNINEDPLFANPVYWGDSTSSNRSEVWYDGDYHLQSQGGRYDPNSGSWITDNLSSPCIDTGDPNSPVGDEPAPNGGIINMGAYGGTTEASLSPDPQAHVAYIYTDNTTAADNYKLFLETHKILVTAIDMNDLQQASLSNYDIIIVGNDTGDHEKWGDEQSVAEIENSGRPVLGLGEGGYACFGKLNLSIGYGNGWHSSQNSIYVVNPDHPVFNTPYPINVPQDRVLQLYTQTRHVGIYHDPVMTETVVALGREVSDPNHYPLIFEHERYLLWGFTESPEKMTDVGKYIFINAVLWMADPDNQAELSEFRAEKSRFY